MKNVLKTLGGISRNAFMGSVFALTATSMAAFALTVPATYAPRQFQTQQTAYMRFVVQATGQGIIVNGVACAAAATGGGNCSVKVGALPYNAFVARAYQQVTTAFNSTTTDTLGLGTASRYRQSEHRCRANRACRHCRRRAHRGGGQSRHCRHRQRHRFDRRQWRLRSLRHFRLYWRQHRHRWHCGRRRRILQPE